ncbi:MAG TPA: DUF481 domain-containing protein [Chitinophagaceae bacterium]|nr:DUF481 domain-containing protein [Chitinophagaceae bacterium]
MRLYCKVIILIFLLITKSHFAGAQIINIDKTDTTAYQKKAAWNGIISSGIEIDKEKSTLFDGTSNLDISLQKQKELFILSASDRFTYDGSTSFLNTGYAHIRWRHDYKAQLHTESFIQYQWDENRGMVHRYLGGVNLRYNFWHKHEWEMTFATGVFYENELWDYRAVDSSKIPPGAAPKRSEKMRSNSYMKWEGSPSKNSNISIIIFYQAPYTDFFNPRISLNVNFTVDISKHFSLGLTYAGLYDSKPVVPITKFYYSFANNLVFKFGS